MEDGAYAVPTEESKLRQLEQRRAARRQQRNMKQKDVNNLLSLDQAWTTYESWHPWYRHQSRRIPGTTRDDESFYQMWNLAEYRSTLRRRNYILLMEWDRRRVLEDRFPQKRFTDSDAQAPSEESQAETVHKCPNCDYASTNPGAFARHVKAHKITGELDNACGRSIHNWINCPFYDDPPGMTSGHPCTNYSRAGVGRQRPEPMPKGASTKK